MTTPRVKKGQVYRDMDVRSDGRTIRIIKCEGERAVCISERTGRNVLIRSKRLLDPKLYKLVSDS